jgi:hypothetical protein
MSDLIKDNLTDYPDVDVLRDLITWGDELKTDRYAHRRLGGLQQLEYFRLLRTLSAANKMLVKMMRDADDGK